MSDLNPPNLNRIQSFDTLASRDKKVSLSQYHSILPNFDSSIFLSNVTPSSPAIKSSRDNTQTIRTFNALVNPSKVRYNLQTNFNPIYAPNVPLIDTYISPFPAKVIATRRNSCDSSYLDSPDVSNVNYSQSLFSRSLDSTTSKESLSKPDNNFDWLYLDIASKKSSSPETILTSRSDQLLKSLNASASSYEKSPNKLKRYSMPSIVSDRRMSNISGVNITAKSLANCTFSGSTTPSAVSSPAKDKNNKFKETPSKSNTGTPVSLSANMSYTIKSLEMPKCRRSLISIDINDAMLAAEEDEHNLLMLKSMPQVKTPNTVYHTISK